MARVAVIGMGAIGASVAAAVADGATHDLVCCVRSSVGAIRVIRSEDRVSLVEGIEADPAQVTGRFDWVFLATKTYQTEGARPWLDRLVGAGTRLAVLQNGITHRERVEPLVDAAAVVLPVVVYMTAERDADGTVRQTRPGSLIVESGPHADGLTQLLAASATDVVPVDDFPTTLWSKLLVNAGAGSIALTRQPNGAAAEPAMAEMLRAMMTEGAAVARAEGVLIDTEAVDRLLARLGSAPNHISSISADLLAGRPLEWEERNATIGRLGRRHGIATPINDAVTALLQTVSGSV